MSPVAADLQSAGSEPPVEIRRRLLSHLLASLSPSASSPARATLSVVSPAAVLLPTLSLIKHLGRSAAGSEELAREGGLTVLLRYGGLSRVATTLAPHRARHDGGLGVTELDSDDSGGEDRAAGDGPDEPDPLSPAESEALRCLCNTLTLHPAAREVFPTVVLEDRTWVQGMVRLLTVQGAAFLAGRLLFLLTSKPGVMVSELSEKGDTIDALAEVRVFFSASRIPRAPLLTPRVRLAVRNGLRHTTPLRLRLRLRLCLLLCLLALFRSSPNRVGCPPRAL